MEDTPRAPVERTRSEKEGVLTGNLSGNEPTHIPYFRRKICTKRVQNIPKNRENRKKICHVVMAGSANQVGSRLSWQGCALCCDAWCKFKGHDLHAVMENTFVVWAKFDEPSHNKRRDRLSPTRGLGKRTQTWTGRGSRCIYNCLESHEMYSVLEGLVSFLAGWVGSLGAGQPGSCLGMPAASAGAKMWSSSWRRC